MAIVSPEISIVSIVGPVRRNKKAGTLQVYRGLYRLCTKSRIIFLGSPSLKLPFNINIALVQTWHRGDRMPGNLDNFNCRPYSAI